jgi:hypothetical protein
METDPRIRVAVTPAAALSDRPRLFGALAAALPVSFTPWSESAAFEALVALTPDPATWLPPPGSSLRTPTFVVGDGVEREQAPEEVRIGDSQAVDRRLRDIVLHDRPVGSVAGDPDQVLAASRSGPIWTLSHPGVPVHRVRSALPELASEQVLYLLLSQRAIAAVALIQFLREVSAEVGWCAPPLRAAFVFDDPNLRRRRYGFIDYRRLLEHADRHDYHAAMAMIPLDGARSNAHAVSLFARRSDRLSLVFHGNDHIQGELLRPADSRSALATAAQAIRRISRFELRTGLHVDRVMMPPHGLCSERMASALARVGFDALCAIHPQPWTAERPTSPLLAAWRPSEFVGGCAVIPRMAINSTSADLALRAFLDHPVVIYGHHDDLAHGLEPLADSVRRIHRLGDVRWMSVGEIALTNVVTRQAADRLFVQPYARRVLVAIPPAVRELVVVSPENVGGGTELMGWSLEAQDLRQFDAPSRVTSGEVHELRLRSGAELDPAEVAAPRWRPWPRMRRVISEARDRALPVRAALTARVRRRSEPASLVLQRDRTRPSELSS